MFARDLNKMSSVIIIKTERRNIVSATVFLIVKSFYIYATRYRKIYCTHMYNYKCSLSFKHIGREFFFLIEIYEKVRPFNKRVDAIMKLMWSVVS